LTPEAGGSGGTEAGSTGESTPLVQKSEATAQAPEAEVPTQAGPQQAGGRRTQLRIVRENIQSLSKDVGSFRKSQEASNRKLEKQVVSLWEESSKSIGFRMSHEASSRKLEKQVISLRKELAALKSQITKEAAKSRTKQDVTLSKILAKVSAKPSKSAKRSKPARHSKK
jgi:hypothetical protein